MALFQIDYFSVSLSRIINFNILIPNDIPSGMSAGNPHYLRGVKTLFLLHGYSGSNRDWLFSSAASELSIKYNLAMIMPSGENSFYLDGKGTGKAFCRFVGEELVQYTCKTFGLSDKKEDIFIGGYSMGGFGALHTALAYPDTFGKAVALSSALIIHDIKNMPMDSHDGFADYDYYQSVFGDLKNLDTSENNPEYVIRKLKDAGREIPGIFMTCGTEDFLIEQNRALYQFLCNENIDVNYQEHPGAHNWDFWNRYMEPAILWLLNIEERS